MTARPLATVWLLLACSPTDLPEADGFVDLRVASGARLQPVAGARAPRVAPGCQPVIDMLPRLQMRLAKEAPPDRLLDAVDRCLADSGRAPELVRLYLAAIAANPHAAYRYRLAGAFVALGDRLEALRHLEAGLAAEPDHAASLFLQGLVLARQAASDPEARRKARAAWQRLLEVDPDYRGFGDVGPEEVRRTVAAWSETPDSAPEEPRATAPTPEPAPAKPAPAPRNRGFARALLDGEAALAERRYDEALRSFEAALGHRPEHVGAGLGLARALAGRGETDAAIARLEALQAARPGDPQVRHELGLVLLRGRGDAAAANAVLDPLRATDQEYARRTGLLLLEPEEQPKKR